VLRYNIVILEKQRHLSKQHWAKNIWQKTFGMKTFEQTTFGKKECVSLSALHDANPIMGLGLSKAGSGRAGPSRHCICPAGKKSLVLSLLYASPPMMKMPTELRVATALYPLGIVRSPILLSSQRWLLWSRTRQEAVINPPTIPPQVAMTGLGFDVKIVTWSYLSAGRSGGEQPVVLGKISTDERLLMPIHPPGIKRTLSSALDGASVETPDACRHCNPNCGMRKAAYS